MGEISFNILMASIPIATLILLIANIFYSERVNENPTTSLGRQCVILLITVILMAIVAVIRDSLGI